MLDELRDSLRSLSSFLAPEERRRVVSSMREAMVHAKMGVGELREAIRTTEARINAERAELDTVRRRQGLAAGIGDGETVAIANRFASQHEERLSMLETKLMAQQQELTVTERELDEMSSQMRLAMAGVDPNARGAEASARREVDAALTDSASGDTRDLPEESAAPRRTRAEREADAEDRLAALKRRMGK